MKWTFRPARDLAEPPLRRLRSQRREQGLLGWGVNALWRRINRFYVWLMHRPRVVGLEHLPVEPPFILVANHTSHLDTLLIASVLRGNAARRVHALAAGDMFFDTMPMALFAALAVNAQPVWRKTGINDIGLLRERLIEDSLVYILFPEGTRSRDGRMATFKAGVGALIAGSPAPVVPCRLIGCQAAWPAGRLLPRPLPVELRVGAPLHFGTAPNDRFGWQDVATACENAVRALE